MTAPEKTQGEMKHPNDMTLDECRDELARNAGWRFQAMGFTREYVTPDTTRPTHITCVDRLCPPYKWTGHGKVQDNNPIPATLDEAAKLPEGWHPEITDCTTRGGTPLHPWIADATNEDTLNVLKGYGTTELEARFRLRITVERTDTNRTTNFKTL